MIACEYDWCSEIPKIHVEQFMVGYVFALLGYPFCVALCGALFSKVLGPIPQVSICIWQIGILSNGYISSIQKDCSK